MHLWEYSSLPSSCFLSLVLSAVSQYLLQSFLGWFGGKGLPWWPQMVKRLLAILEIGFDPWVGKIPWRRAWQPIPVFLPGEMPQNLPMASQHANKLNPTNKSLHDLCLTNTPDSFPITMPVLILLRSAHSSSLAVRGIYCCFLYYSLYLANFYLKHS